MDKKITELDLIQRPLTEDEYFVVGSVADNESYKIKATDLPNIIPGFVNTETDDHLSLTSTNPVENRVITQYLEQLQKENDDSDLGNFDISIVAVETTTLPSNKQAKVEIIDYGVDENNVKSLAFKFGIPKGQDGKDGTSGSSDDGEQFGYRTVFAFQSSKTQPDKPIGGFWDVVSNEITYPDGWSNNDELERPVWMSNATFDYEGIVGEWTDPVQISGDNGTDGKDGKDGSDGADGSSLEFIYKQTITEEQPVIPQNNKFIDDYVPRSEGWEDHPQGVNEYVLCEWVCTRKYDKSTSMWGDWTAPILWSKYGSNGRDGDSIEYIYQRSSSLNAKPATPGTAPAAHSPVQDFQEREFIPAKAFSDEHEWTDTPTDVTIDTPYEWVSIRKFKWSEQKWGSFEEPTVWAKYGKDGEEGTSSFKSFVFCRTNFTPVAPIANEHGGTYSDPVPKSRVQTNTGSVLQIYWSDSVPEGNEQIWMTSRIFSSNGLLPQQDYWTEPQAMSDTADLEIMYSPNLIKTNLPDGFKKDGIKIDRTWEIMANEAGWYDNANEWGDAPTVWMATNQAKNGIWSGWQIVKVQGEKGEAGTSLAIKGSYDSFEDLSSAQLNGKLPGNNPPVVGDSYLVNGEIYIWDGDSWAYGGYVKGDPGKGIVNNTSFYAISQYNVINEQRPITGNWVSTSPTTDPVNKYLWKKTTIKYGYVGDTATDDVTYYELIGTHGDTGEKGDNGKGIDYIDTQYNISNIKTGVNDESIYPNILGYQEWNNYSPDVNNDYKYLWKRTKVIFTDGTSSDAWSYELIGSLGEPGIDGTNGLDGQSIEYAFILTTDKEFIPDTPIGSVTGNTPGNWTNDPQYLGEQNGIEYKYQWVSQRVKPAGVDTAWDTWSTPTVWSELYPGTYLHVKYSNDMKNFTTNNGDDVGKFIGVLTDYNVAASMTFDDYTWRKFQGDDGFGREYIFTLGNDYNNPPSLPTDNEQVEQYQPSGWSTSPLSPTLNNKYCWSCHREYRNNIWGNWTGNGTPSKAYVFSMYAESVPGQPGSAGPTIYPAGYFESDKTYTQTLGSDGEPTATPYVLYNDKMYILNVEQSTAGSFKESEWTKAEMYNALYTDILLADNAKVGSAVFNQKYIFSQNGEGDISTFDGSVDNPYAVEGGFKPAWCTNLVTGEMWAGTGSSYFAADGSGHLANGNLYWTADGKLYLPISANLELSYESSYEYFNGNLNIGITTNGTYGDQIEPLYKIIDESGQTLDSYYFGTQYIPFNTELIHKKISKNARKIQIVENGDILIEKQIPFPIERKITVHSEEWANQPYNACTVSANITGVSYEDGSADRVYQPNGVVWEDGYRKLSNYTTKNMTFKLEMQIDRDYYNKNVPKAIDVYLVSNVESQSQRILCDAVFVDNNNQLLDSYTYQRIAVPYNTDTLLFTSPKILIYAEAKEELTGPAVAQIDIIVECVR